MSAKALIGAASGNSAAPLYSDDVFSTYTYTGNGGTQTITNGIDLAGNGGLVWVKGRNSATSHFLQDTAQGTQFYLQSNSTSGTLTGNYVTTTSTGFSWAGATFGDSGINLVAHTFRKAPKFFDCGTFTAGTNTNRRISHSLGVAPAMVIVKRTDGAEQWWVYSSALGRNELLKLNTTDAKATRVNTWGASDPTTTDFGIDEAYSLFNTGTYVWYAFANDASTDGIIQCGSFTTDASGNATVNLGWEPQYLMCKRSDGVGDWFIDDQLRGMPVSSTNISQYVIANGSNAEATGGVAYPTAVGFVSTGFALPASSTFIYLAIRRPNKPPTTGTQVYNAIARAGTGSTATVTGVGFAPDLVISKNKASGFPAAFLDRLRGATKGLISATTAAEYTQADTLTSFEMDGYTVGADTNQLWINTTLAGAGIYVNWSFRRAVGVFDVVCYTGTGTNAAKSHSLGVAPELVIYKSRSQVNGWYTYSQAIGTSNFLRLNLTNASADMVSSGAAANWTAPTTTSIYPDANFCSGAGETYVAYLFSTKAGISKVGSYTGNGTTQTINCGFTTGARFVMIKRTDVAGDWYVLDSVRGIVAGNDPYISLNTTAAEVTTDDSIDPDNTGFIVNQLAATNINVNTATYIFLAFA